MSATLTPRHFDPSRVVGKMTPAEYLAFERKADYWHEFIEGKVIARAASSYHHACISTDTQFALMVAFSARERYVFNHGMRIQVGDDGPFFYPDLSITSRKSVVTDGDCLRNPCALIEILSDETAEWDGNGKFLHYQKIPLLRHYLLIAQDRPAVTHYEKNDSGKWEIAGDYSKLTDAVSLTLDGKAVSVPLAEMYDRLTFTEDAAPNTKTSVT